MVKKFLGQKSGCDKLKEAGERTAAEMDVVAQKIEKFEKSFAMLQDLAGVDKFMAAHLETTFEKDMEVAMKEDMNALIDQLTPEVIEQLAGGIE